MADDRPAHPSLADHPRLPLVHLLRAVALDYDRHVGEFAAAAGLHGTDLRALIALLDLERAGESAGPGRLGAALGFNSPAVTALLDRLEGLGLVRRERDPDDRRRVRLVVTERARELGWSHFAPIIAGCLDVFDRFPDADLAAFERVMTALRERESRHG